MKNRIEVSYQLATKQDEIVTIPVQYKVVDDSHACVKTVYCTVDLPFNRIPDWLTPSSFSIVNHYRSGFHMINYNDKEVDNMDAEFFRYKLYADIMLTERLKEGIGMEHC